MDHTLQFINDTNFDTEVLETPGLFILKLCKGRQCDPHSFDKVEEELANEYQGEARFGLLDVDENQYTTHRLNVVKGNMYIFFKNNQEIARSGSINKEKLKEIIHENFRY